jgi:hypothetical protein
MINFNLKESFNEGNNAKKSMFIWCLPAKGHLNPALCFTNQILLKLNDFKISKIIFYCTASFRDAILNLPNNKNNQIEFRDFRFDELLGSENYLKLIMNFDTRPGRLFRAFRIWENAIKFGQQYLFDTLVEDIYRERPAFILYDQALFFPKLAFKIYSKRYSCPEPLHVAYCITFMCAKGIYPEWRDMLKMGMLGSNSSKLNLFKSVLVTTYDLIRYVFIYYKTLIWNFNFSFRDILSKCELPFERNVIIDSNLNLVFVLPELQPKPYLFDATKVKFVGPALDDSVRSRMNKYEHSIVKFLCRNEQSKSENQLVYLSELSSLALKPIIYVSLGTVFNNENSHVFKTIAKACEHFADNFNVIISTGDEETYKVLNNVSNQILFVPHTPQVELLKLTHLFITHAGMNSVSEALQYGVPIICLPLSGDQPFVAWRVADELGIGIRLQADGELTVNKVKVAIEKILNDSAYHERAKNFSETSKKYFGTEKATEFLLDFILTKYELFD